MFLARSDERHEGAAASRKRIRQLTPSSGLSKGLTVAMLGVIAALILLMAFAPAGSIYQG